MSLEDEHNLLSFKNVVDFLGRSPGTVRKWLKGNNIKSVKPPFWEAFYLLRVI